MKRGSSGLTPEQVDTGRYMVNGWPALVIRDKEGVSVKYDNGCYTAAFLDTFINWNIQKLEK